jgi:hypothetical protein
VEYGSAAENPPGGEWTPIREGIGKGIGITGGFDVYGKNHYIYAAGYDFSTEVPKVFIVDGTTNEAVCEGDGSETPAGEFSFKDGNASIAVDQSNGDFYLDDTKVNKVVDRFDSECHFVDQLPSDPPKIQHPDFRAGLAVDDPCVGAGETSCDLGGYHGSNTGYVFVGSGETESSSRLFAFRPRLGGAPEVEAQTAIDVTTDEARLTAKLNPHSLETTYHFDYISQADYEADGEEFGAGAQSAPLPDADAGDGPAFIPVSTPIAGLEADTAYRFRLVASNCEAPLAVEGECLTVGEGEPGEEGADAVFATYRPEPEGLPDARGYELVTPPDTGGYFPTMAELSYSGLAPSIGFATDLATAGGEGLLFGIEGGSMPGLLGNGFHDTYEAHREAEGGYGRWQTEFDGVDGAEAWAPTPGGSSTDRAAAFWAVGGGGGIVSARGNYIRRAGGVLDPACAAAPEAELEAVGCGSLGTDLFASGKWISPGAEHVIVETQTRNGRPAQQLEPEAAPTGTGAVYDRTPDGVTHVVSLKPDGTAFGNEENAFYLGASHDGSAVAFEVKGTLYVRLDDEKTVEADEGGSWFGGISAHGERVFYLHPDAGESLVAGTGIPQGEIFACEVRSGPCAGPEASQAPIRVGSGEEEVLVNVSADGSHVYFAEAGSLYVWDDSGVQLIGQISHDDLIGRPSIVTQRRVGGLGLWATEVLISDPAPWYGPANDPSRTTPDGTVLVFESRAALTGYDAGGHSEVYRYDAADDSLRCLSCNPSNAAAVSDAQLQVDPPRQFESLPPLNAITSIAGVTANGRRVFFQSADRLVLGDTDGKLDVYEWEAEGEGDCAEAGGCLRLISSGHSGAEDYLYAMSPDGRDVFFESGDRLTPRDTQSAPSIYDARIGGGEAPQSSSPRPCLGEACQPAAVAPPDATPTSSSFEGQGNLSPPARRCAAKRAGQHHARKRCGKRHSHRAHHRRQTHPNRRAAR